MELNIICGIIAISILLPIAIVLLFIVLDKDFNGYTRKIPLPPKSLRPKKSKENG
ncbi:hypothetical protein [Flavobacterium koreense]